MDEAKSLAHMALTAMYAAMILMAASALIGLGYLMWSAFSDQDATNKRMQNYAQYAAFDNTMVRGQDIISLLHDTQGDPFVFVVSDVHCDTDAASSKYVESNTNKFPVLIAYNGAYVDTIDFSTTDEYTFSANGAEVDWHMKRSLKEMVNNGSLADSSGLRNASIAGAAGAIDTKHLTARIDYSDYNNPVSYDTLQDYFLQRGYYVSTAKKQAGDAGQPQAGYLRYQSYIIYDTVTSEVAGVVLIEDTSNLTLSEG